MKEKNPLVKLCYIYKKNLFFKRARLIFLQGHFDSLFSAIFVPFCALLSPPQFLLIAFLLSFSFVLSSLCIRKTATV